MKTHFEAEKISKLKLSTYEHEGNTFVRLAGEHKPYPRGTVFHKDGVVPGYPRIMRVLHLGRGVKRYFKESFYIEEKVDGYNVRVALINGKPHAFTRGGFLCPFTTDRIPELIDTNFFVKNPSMVICGEVVGPGSPYNSEEIPYVAEDVKFFAFDVFSHYPPSIPADGGVPPAQKYAILEREGIPQVRRWGEFNPPEIEKIKALVLELDRDGREGIVMKPSGEGKTIKYVTPSSCLRDIEATSALMAELPAGFYIQRIMRALFFSLEFGIPLSDDYLLSAARALYRPNERLLKELDEGGAIRETFRISVKDKGAVDGLLHHLRQTNVSATLTSLERADAHLKATFHRTYRKGTRDLKRKLRGHGFFD